MRLRVVELIPPAVATGLAGAGANHGAPVDEFCDTVYPRVVTGNIPEVGLALSAWLGFQCAFSPKTWSDGR